MVYMYEGIEGVRGNEEEEPKVPPFPFLKKKAYHSFEQTFTIHQTHFYLSDFIGEPADYVELIHKIKTSSPGDVVFIHLNTPGGRLDTGIQIINAMQASQAKIITVLDSMAHSLGTMIFLAGDEYIVHDHALIMIHNFRGGVEGKGHEQFAQLDATIKWFSGLAKKLYVPFLTDEELDNVLQGKDIWMASPEIRKRLDKMVGSSSKKTKSKKKDDQE